MDINILPVFTIDGIKSSKTNLRIIIWFVKIRYNTGSKNYKNNHLGGYEGSELGTKTTELTFGTKELINLLRFLNLILMNICF